MKRDIARRRTLLGLSALFLGAAPARGQAPAVSHTIDLATPDRATDYDYLRTAVGARSIVQLGESIHLTDEFPRAQLRLVQHLHESMGFDVLALEGSVVNAWLAMERLYGAPNDTAAVAAAQEIAWFPLWDTSAMREVMRYVAATQRTASPLYLASFDMQAGQSRATGDRVFDSCLRRWDGSRAHPSTLVAGAPCCSTHRGAATHTREPARTAPSVASRAGSMRRRSPRRANVRRPTPRPCDWCREVWIKWRDCARPRDPALRSHARSHAIRWPPATCSRCATAYHRHTRS